MFWSRSQLKSAAKQDLTGYYWISFLVCLIASFLGGGQSFSFNNNFGSNSWQMPAGLNANLGAALVFVVILIIVFLLAFAGAAAFSIFVSGPIIVGKCKFFVHLNEGDRNIGTLFSAFKKGGYISVVSAMFMKNLFVFLWSLLFIIPGIVKGYQYRMVPYILSEVPNITYKEALQISSAMTNGEKFNMFVLDLSFIGWYILGVLALGVGVLFVHPYAEATWAQLYLTMRQKINFNVN